MVIQYATLNDIHMPYESKAFYKALDLAEKWPALRGLFLNGDVAEIESVSTHPKSPAAQRSLLAELDYVNKKFDMIEKRFAGLPVELIEGNHCYRIFRYIRDIAPEMWGMIHTPKLFGFDRRKKWHFTPYGPTQWFQCAKTKLWLRHEPLVMGNFCARGTAVESSVSVLFGHTHQYQIATHKKKGPAPYIVTAMSGGWLGDIKAPCFDYRGSRDNWVNGFTRIDVDDRTWEYELRFIPL